MKTKFYLHLTFLCLTVSLFGKASEILDTPSLSITSYSSTHVSFSWVDNAPNETGWIIEREVGPNWSTWDDPVVFSFPANTTSYTDNTVVVGNTYYYRLKSFNAIETSGWSFPPRSVLIELTLEAPTNLNASNVTNNSINLNWTDNAQFEEGYQLQRATNSGFSSNLATIYVPGGTNTTSYIDRDLNSSTTYYYRVRAHGQAQQVFSTFSNTTSSSTTTNPNSERITIQTFNILEGGKLGMDKIFNVINSQGSDIVFIQESSYTDTRLADHAVANGYEYHQGPSAGTAVLSKFRILEAYFYYPMTFARLELEPGNEIMAISVHLSPGNNHSSRDYQLRSFVRDHLREAIEKYPVIAAGDYNIWPNDGLHFQMSNAGLKLLPSTTGLDYIYMHGLEHVAGTNQVIGGTLDQIDPEWPSDHPTVVTDIYKPIATSRQSESFTIENAVQSRFSFSFSDFQSKFSKGTLTQIEIRSLPIYGNLKLNGQYVRKHQIIPANELSSLTYDNLRIGMDEFSWLGSDINGYSRTSSWVFIDNIDIIKNVSKKHGYFAIDKMAPNSVLSQGSTRRFVSSNNDKINGGEVLQIPRSLVLSYFYWTFGDIYSFDLNKRAEIFIAFDDEIMPIPNWLSENFTPQNSTFIVGTKSLKVFSKKFSKGDKVWLGTNGYSYAQRDNIEHYAVIASELPEIPDYTVESTNLRCYGINDGTISFVTAGTGNYQFALNDGEFSTNREFTNLAAGDYTLKWLVEGIEEITFPITIAGPEVLSGSIQVTNPSCIGENGIITINVTGGNGAKMIKYNGGIATQNNVYELVPGTYDFEITDENGCTFFSSVSVVEGSEKPEKPVILLNQDGKLAIIVTGSPTIKWYRNGSLIPGEVSPILNRIPNGEYTASVANGSCETQSDPFVIVGLEEMKNELVIRPNPASHLVHVDLSPELTDKVKEIRFLDLSGKVVKQQSFQQELQLNFLNPGVYFIQFITENSTVIRKLVKE